MSRYIEVKQGRLLTLKAKINLRVSMVSSILVNNVDTVIDIISNMHFENEVIKDCESQHNIIEGNMEHMRMNKMMNSLR